MMPLGRLSRWEPCPATPGLLTTAPPLQDPVFARLVGHPRLMEAMVDIDGTEFLYQGSQAHHRLPDDNGPWHCVRSTYLFTALRPLTPRRCPPAQDHVPPHPFHRPVKVNLYLDAVYPGDGALELIPGTHHPELAADILKRLGYYAELTGVRPAVAVGGGPRLRDAVADHVPKVAPELHPGDAIIFRASSQRPWVLSASC